MRALRIVVGVVLALVALFAGGCSVFWTVFLTSEGDPYGFWPITLGGYLLAAVAGALAWWALRWRRNGAPLGGEGE